VRGFEERHIFTADNADNADNAGKEDWFFLIREIREIRG